MIHDALEVVHLDVQSAIFVRVGVNNPTCSLVDECHSHWFIPLVVVVHGLLRLRWFARQVSHRERQLAIGLARGRR